MNKQITEDYVSYETAKLLKEKGFDVPLYWYYDRDGILHNITYYCGSHIEANFNHQNIKDEEMTSAPTQSIALKWLREVHNIYIDILTYTTGKNVQFRWVGYDNGRLFSQEEGKTIYFNSYEQAAEAACLYVLKMELEKTEKEVEKYDLGE